MVQFIGAAAAVVGAASAVMGARAASKAAEKQRAAIRDAVRLRQQERERSVRDNIKANLVAFASQGRAATGSAYLVQQRVLQAADMDRRIDAAQARAGILDASTRAQQARVEATAAVASSVYSFARAMQETRT